MKEFLTPPAHEGVSAESDLIQSLELDSQQGAQIGLGVRAVELSHSPGTMKTAERVDDSSSDAMIMESVEHMSSNPEGGRNAELFKQAYDTVIEAIESAFEAEGDELSNNLAIIMSDIDALRATPYISSVPEFVDFVQAARSNIEEANSYTASDVSSGVKPAIASALTQAKQHLASTTVAYRPQA